LISLDVAKHSHCGFSIYEIICRLKLFTEQPIYAGSSGKTANIIILELEESEWTA